MNISDAGSYYVEYCHFDVDFSEEYVKSALFLLCFLLIQRQKLTSPIACLLMKFKMTSKNEKYFDAERSEPFEAIPTHQIPQGLELSLTRLPQQSLSQLWRPFVFVRVRGGNEIRCI